MSMGCMVIPLIINRFQYLTLFLSVKTQLVASDSQTGLGVPLDVTTYQVVRNRKQGTLFSKVSRANSNVFNGKMKQQRTVGRASERYAGCSTGLAQEKK